MWCINAQANECKVTYSTTTRNDPENQVNTVIPPFDYLTQRLKVDRGITEILEPEMRDTGNASFSAYIMSIRCTICIIQRPSPIIVTIKKLLTRMAKFVFIAVLLIAAVAVSEAAPSEFEPQEMAQRAEAFQNQEIEEREEHLRFRRVTCDLLSFGGVVGDSACAANCLSMGKAGGSCNGGICECRRETFKDLWDRRFG